MNVSLNNSLDYLRMNSISGKRNLSGGNRKFSDIMTSNAEKVKSDKYLRGTSLPELTDEDYEYLSSKWNPNQMSKAEYEDFLGVLQEKGIISKDDKAYHSSHDMPYLFTIYVLLYELKGININIHLRHRLWYNS